MLFGKDRSLSAVLFSEAGEWVAQCLEHDIASQAETADAAQAELMRLILAHVYLDLEEGVRPLSTLPKSPDKYWKMFSAVQESPKTEKLVYQEPKHRPTKVEPTKVRVACAI